MPDLRVLRIPFSTNAERVALAAGRKGLEVDRVDVDSGDRGMVRELSGQDHGPGPAGARHAGSGGPGVRGRRTAPLALAVVGVAALSLNLRPAVVAISPVLGELRLDTGLSATAASLLTTVPLVCFAVFSLVAPRLGRRLGIEATLLGVAVVIVAGTLLRLGTPVAALFAGSAVAGAGIAVGNVLVPGLIKRDFPGHVGLMTGVYSMALNGGAALAAGATVPLQHALDLGWRGAVALWAGLAGLAVAVWIPLLRGRRRRDDGPPRAAGRRSLWREPVAWQVSAFLGLQSLEFYGLTAWIPTLLTDHGMGEATAGLMLSVLAVAGIGSSFLVPVLAGRARRQRHLVVAVVALFLVGIVGLIVAPVRGALVWMIVIGLGQGAGIGLALVFFVLRTATARDAADLSGMAQTVGYLVAATGPFAVGALHDATGGWTVPLLALVVGLGGMLVSGCGAGLDRTLGEDVGPPRARARRLAWSGLRARAPTTSRGS